MEEAVTTIVRHGEPNSLDCLPMHTRCKVQVDKDRYDLYIQMSSDETAPVWQLVGTFESELEE